MNNRTFAILFALLAFIASSTTAQQNASPPGAITLGWFDTGPVLPGQRIRAPVNLRRGSRLLFDNSNNAPGGAGRQGGTQLFLFDSERSWQECAYQNAIQLAGPPGFNSMPVVVSFTSFGRYWLAGSMRECLANTKVIVDVRP